MLQKKHPSITIHEITRIGVMAAAVYVASVFLQIPIPTAIDNTRLHMGNVLCLLAGLLLGPFQGALAAGLGSMLFDLTSPAYVASAPFTFLFKFIMAWLCGRIASGHTTRDERSSSGRQPYRPGVRTRCFLGAVTGSFTYVLLYLGKSFIEHRYILQLPLAPVLLTVSQKAVVSGVNAAVSVLVAVPLAVLLRPALLKYGSQR